MTISAYMLRELASLANNRDTFEDFATRLLRGAAEMDALSHHLAKPSDATPLPEPLKNPPAGHGPLECMQCKALITDGRELTTNHDGHYLHAKDGGILHWPKIAGYATGRIGPAAPPGNVHVQPTAHPIGTPPKDMRWVCQNDGTVMPSATRHPSCKFPLCLCPPAPAALKCKARTGGSPGEPQDCDWPTCGCDAHATKVINALEESGYLLVSRDLIERLAAEPVDYRNRTSAQTTQAEKDREALRSLLNQPGRGAT